MELQNTLEKNDDSLFEKLKSIYNQAEAKRREAKNNFLVNNGEVNVIELDEQVHERNGENGRFLKDIDNDSNFNDGKYKIEVFEENGDNQKNENNNEEVNSNKFRKLKTEINLRCLG